MPLSIHTDSATFQISRAHRFYLGHVLLPDVGGCFIQRRRYSTCESRAGRIEETGNRNHTTAHQHFEVHSADHRQSPASAPFLCSGLHAHTLPSPAALMSIGRSRSECYGRIHFDEHHDSRFQIPDTNTVCFGCKEFSTQTIFPAWRQPTRVASPCHQKPP